MKSLFMVFAAVLFTIPAWADDLKPEPLNQEVNEYNSFWASKDIDPMNHQVWKLYILGSLTPNNNYNHEKEIFITSLVPKSPYIVYVRINQLYNFLQPIPKVGDVIAVEGRIVNHYYSTIQGSWKTKRIPVLYMYVENASKLPDEPSAATLISTPEPQPTLAAVSTPALPTSAALVTATPGFFKADPGTPVH